MKRPTDPAADRIKRLQAFADSLVAKRKEAVDARSASGVERIWTEDEELYDSIDDLNRGDVGGAKWEKGPTIASGVTAAGLGTNGAGGPKSTIFVNIVQTYVDMAAAAIADMLLPTDDMPFGVDSTPEPDLEEAAKTKDPTQFVGPDGQPKTAGEIAAEMLSEAKDIAKRVETKIWDWLIESQWHSEVRKLIDEAAKIGTSVLKGPVPIEQKSKKIDRNPKTNEVVITMTSKLKPTSKQISPRNFFPDPACGENIQNGSYTWERDKITGRQLRKMMTQLDSDGELFYLTSQIKQVLLEGPDKKYTDGTAADGTKADGDLYTIWYFHGSASAEDMAAAGCDCEEGNVIPAMITVVNDCVIRASVSTMDSGEFPYDVLIWQRVPGKWWGKGECRKLRHCQRMLNAGVRAMLDNAGLSSGPQIAIDTEVLEPADGVMSITPLKLWLRRSGVELGPQGMKGAIESIQIESLQEQLMNIINFAIEIADKIATMPIQQQGQQGVTQETAEGRRLLQNNAGVTKRRLAKLFDDRITEPHVGRYHEWMLLFDDDDELKRELVIDAKGSSALYERDAQNVFVTQMSGLVKDPAFDLSPKRWMEEMLKGNKLDPKRFKPTDEERAQMAQQQPPKDPKIAVAEITADTRLKVAQVDTDRDTKYVEAQTARDQNQQEHLERKLHIEWQLGVLRYANDRRITLDKAKTELAKVAMTLRSQEKLAMNPPPGAPQVAKEQAEPAGRAPSGEAFQK